jgi:hypothetical protein
VLLFLSDFVTLDSYAGMGCDAGSEHDLISSYSYSEK